LKEQVIAVIKRHALRENFDAAMPLVQLGIDSLQLIQVILAIETELGLVAPDEYMKEEWFRTPESIAQLFEHVAANHRS
jgi:acyl carrier protein